LISRPNRDRADLASIMRRDRADPRFD